LSNLLSQPEDVVDVLVRKRIRFTPLQKAEYDAAHAVAADPGASEKDKARASKTLRRLLRERGQKRIRKQALLKHGPKPQRERFGCDEEYALAVAAWRDKLELDAVNRTLDDPTSSASQRYQAKKLLKELEARLKQRCISPYGESIPVSRVPESGATVAKLALIEPAPAPVANTFSSPAVAAFLESLGGGETDVQEIEPTLDLAGVDPPEKPDAVTGHKIEGFCPDHQCPLELCECHKHEVCAVHLLEKQYCGCK
jgi:hypothetical protein